VQEQHYYYQDMIPAADSIHYLPPIPARALAVVAEAREEEAAVVGVGVVDKD
jgi:hypothetical protein